MTAAAEYTCKHAPACASEYRSEYTAGRTAEHTAEYTAGCTVERTAEYTSIGTMTMPVNFRYAEIFRRGRPRHGKPGVLSTYDAFYVRHPPMDNVRRAKLFNAFDALTGFDDRVAAKEVLYEERQVLTEEEKEELDRRLAVIRSLAPDTRKARENQVRIEVTYFSPCTDPESEFFGSGRGRYLTAAGIVRKVDILKRRILIKDESIDLDSVIAISGNPLFDQEFSGETLLRPGGGRTLPGDTQMYPADTRIPPGETAWYTASPFSRFVDKTPLRR